MNGSAVRGAKTVEAEVRLELREELSSYEDLNDLHLLKSATSMDRANLRRRPFFFRGDGRQLALDDLYSGQSVFVICNGPSCTPSLRQALQRAGVLTFGINNGAFSFHPNLWACVDAPHRFVECIWKDPAILKFSPFANLRGRLWDSRQNKYSSTTAADCPNVAWFLRNERFCASSWLTERTFNWGNHSDLGGGRSVLLPALKICCLLGFANIFLVGCDMHMEAKRPYWFAERRNKVMVANNAHTYACLQGYLDELEPHLRAGRHRVFNLNPESALRVFPFIALDEALERAAIPRFGTTAGMYSR